MSYKAIDERMNDVRGHTCPSVRISITIRWVFVGEKKKKKKKKKNISE
jgi:hypothetical protein